MAEPMPVDVEAVLASLKDFQRATVDHVVERLWTSADHTRNFLVADEVGLGKTMVAKGVIARTIEHLWPTDKRIDIIYICSNSQIAQQNLRRLSVIGGQTVAHADRLTMLPTVVKQLRSSRINFVSFTPGTSFQVGEHGGKAAERVLLYWLLRKAWGREEVAPRRWVRFFEGGVRKDRFARMINDFDHRSVDNELAEVFEGELAAARRSNGNLLSEDLRACVGEFSYLRGKPASELSRRRFRIVGELRSLVARASVHALEPDLVILDEFQRFKDLLDDEESDGAQLARALFDYPDARTLLLSATPYKMYTLPDEPEGEDHYRDFARTVQFLAGRDVAESVSSGLADLRTAAIAGDQLSARDHRNAVQEQLRRVMCRTERLSTTRERDGMLVEKSLSAARLTSSDVLAYRTSQQLAQSLESQDVFEHWRSAPYLLNVMDRRSYQLTTRFEAAVERQDPAIRDLLAAGRGLLDWEDIEAYRAIDPANTKLRGLAADVVDRGAWKLAWLPPSLPYYELGGAYAEPCLREFTKRLVFSAWAVVPKAIAVMLSYEIERQLTLQAGTPERPYSDRSQRPLLMYQLSHERLTGMPVLALVYPSVVLSRLGDPWRVAADTGRLPASADEVTTEVARRIGERLTDLPDPPQEPGEVPDQRWYWAAPILLDQLDEPDRQQQFQTTMRGWVSTDDAQHQSRLADHVELALGFRAEDLKARPSDLVAVLAALAIGGLGNCSVRALSRVCGGEQALREPEIRDRAVSIAGGLRSLFNRPEIIALLRSGDDAESYWRLVLAQSLEGCLQAVLDEYVHALLESEGLQDSVPAARATALADAMIDALSIKTASNSIEHIEVIGEEIRTSEHRIRSHAAARFGRAQSDDKTVMRESSVRRAFNSPFWPFVLASTSVGQEGLDFHTYSHAVVHWNLPGNPVDLEQREGRVHRYKGHAVRKNIAATYADAALRSDLSDPWEAMFASAAADRPAGESELVPFWVFTIKGGATIERYVPVLPLSREADRYRRLLRTVGAYRLVFGQPRQEDLLRYLNGSDFDPSVLAIDLSPARTPNV